MQLHCPQLSDGCPGTCSAAGVVFGAEGGFHRRDPGGADHSEANLGGGATCSSVLSSYLRNRPLKVLRAVDDMNGFEVWRRLTAELEPSSRSRSLAMAQALVGFPSMSKGASLMDYILTYEKLVNEYERLSGVSYDSNLKLGTLLKGTALQLRQHVLVDINDRTTYQELRSKLLQYERSNQTWSAENILGSLSVQSHHSSSSSKEYQGPIPMEVDRLHGDRRRDPKGKGDPKGTGKGKGEYKGKGKGYGGYGRGRGGKGKGKKGKGRGGKGKKGYGGYGGKGKGDGKDKGVTCYNCGKTGHISSECWSRPNDSKGKGKKGKIRNVREDEESDSWNESSQHDHTQGQQRGNQDVRNVRRAGDVRGNERVRRIETGSMPTIEEVEDDEDFIDLGALFAGFNEGDAVRMVKMIPVCDMSMGDKKHIAER